MNKPDTIKAQIENNNRVFMLMIGYGKANLFRYLNREYMNLIKQKNQVTRREARWERNGSLNN